MPKHVVLSEVCHRLLKMRAAQLGVSMGDAVMAWLHEASVPLDAPVVPPAARDRHDAWRVPAGGVSPAATALASEIVAKASNGPFSKAAQLGRKS